MEVKRETDKTTIVVRYFCTICLSENLIKNANRKKITKQGDIHRENNAHINFRIQTFFNYTWNCLKLDVLLDHKAML